MICHQCKQKTPRDEVLKVYAKDDSDFWLVCSIEPCLTNLKKELEHRGVSVDIVFPQ